MGIQDNLLMETLHGSSVNTRPTAKAADTFEYVTDLLAELRSISNMSGLSALSDDIQSVISKHMANSASAA